MIKDGNTSKRFGILSNDLDKYVTFEYIDMALTCDCQL